MNRGEPHPPPPDRAGDRDGDVLRLRIDLAYDGTDFSGWAAQPGRRTVEAELAAGLARILRSDDPLTLTVAGRTDAGVHARGAVAHVDVAASAWSALPGRSGLTPDDAAPRRLRGVLPPDIVVRAVRPAPAGFDARFSALRRRYRYRICDAPERLDPLRRRDTLIHPGALDAAAMDAAAGRLVGLHDFAAFCRRREGASTVRTLLTYRWSRVGPLLVADVVADAFCHSMVRALVGAALPVGAGRRPVDWPREVQRRGVRDPAVAVVAPHGLSLEEVVYPDDDELADRARQSRAVRVLPASPSVEPSPNRTGRAG